MISLIVAHSRNMVIGKDNELPWYLPSDLKKFKEITTAHTVIMGRNTYESIVARIHKPLPNRRNIVVSKTLSRQNGIEIAESLSAALSLSEDNEQLIIGGAKLYTEALKNKLVDRMYITLIDKNIDGDVYFPDYNDDDWITVNKELHNENGYQFSFNILDRK